VSAVSTFLAECTPDDRARFTSELASATAVQPEALAEAVWTRVLPGLLERHVPEARWRKGTAKTRRALARELLGVVNGTSDVRPEDRAARLLELIEQEPKPMAYVLSSLVTALDHTELSETRANHLGYAMARAVMLDPESAPEILSCLKGPT